MIYYYGWYDALEPWGKLLRDIQKNVFVIEIKRRYVSALNYLILHYDKIFSSSPLAGNFRSLTPKLKKIFDCIDITLKDKGLSDKMSVIFFNTDI